MAIVGDESTAEHTREATITIWLVGLPFLCPMGIIIKGERPKPITHLVSRKTEALTHNGVCF